MNDETLQEQISDNEESYDRLIATIESSRGMLSLFVASCNDRAFRDSIIQRYETELADTMPGYRVQLNFQEPSLRSALEQLVAKHPELQAGNAAVLTVTGAEDLLPVALGNGETRTEIDRFFGYLQWTREGLREFPFPIVVWVTPQILKQMSFKAPDFWSWRTGVFRFVATEEAAIKTPTHTHELQWMITEELESLPLDELLLSVQQIEAEQGLRSPALATLYDRLGQAYRSRVRAGKVENVQQEIELSIAYFQKAIDLQAARGEKLNLAHTLNRLGNFYEELGQYQLALELYKQSLELYENIGEFQEKAAISTQLAMIYANRGEFDRAIALYKQSLELSEKIGDIQGKAGSLSCLAMIYANRGEFDRAIALFQKSLELYENVGDVQGRAGSLNCLAIIYANRGEFDRAISLCQKSLELYEKIGDVQGRAASLHQLAIIYADRGEFDRAIALCQKSLELYENMGDVQGRVASLHQLAIIYANQGGVDRAIDFDRQSLEIAREIGDRSSEAKSLGNLGIAYQLLGQYQQAIDFYQQSLAIKREIGDRFGEANSLFNQGIALAELDKHGEALRSYQQAKQIFEELQIPDKVEKCDIAIAEQNTVRSTK